MMRSPAKKNRRGVRSLAIRGKARVRLDKADSKVSKAKVNRGSKVRDKAVSRAANRANKVSGKQASVNHLCCVVDLQIRLLIF